MTDFARTAGRLAAVPIGALAAWRRGKPMHPRGAVFDGLLDRLGAQAGLRPWGVPWLDGTATDRVVVRLSRGAGLPAPLPDLLGLAVSVPRPGADPVDLLLSSTGHGPVTRFVPFLRRDAAAVYSTIMAYRSDGGAVRIAAFPEVRGAPSEPGPLASEVRRADLVFTLAAARGLGAWRPFARLTLTGPAASLDPDVRFDPVRHPPPGLVADGPLARFRAPAYAAARAARNRRTPPSPGPRPGRRSPDGMAGRFGRRDPG